jgi:DNA-binding NtrC family response regulator
MRKKVLLVDDEESLRLSLGFWLRRNDFHVTSCGRVEDARTALDREAFDCVISDLRLSPNGAEGLSLLRLAREANPRSRCVLITASPVDDLLAGLAGDVGLTLCPKPVDVVDLLQLLESPATALPF